jgi:hypothetical protein
MKKELLKDLLSSKGSLSSMRWAFVWSNKICWSIGIVAVLGVLIIGGYAVYNDKDLAGIAPYASAVLIGAASIIGAIMAAVNIGKAAQSHAENKAEKNDIQ